MDTVSSLSWFRDEGYPTRYGRVAYQLWFDVTFFRVVSVTLAVLLSFVVILPGFRGKQVQYRELTESAPLIEGPTKQRWLTFCRWSPVILISFLLIVCNFMPYWESGSLDVRTPYRSGSNAHINATIGVNIGLRGMNVTLKGLPVEQNNDRIDYNEHFSWVWMQGRPGFGYDAGTLHREYRHAQLRGLPYPILWVAETFTIDYGKVRIGRYYRQSGWFAHVFLWLAVPLFLLANILFQMVIQYGSLFMILTGMSLLMSNILVTAMRSTIPFSLAFQALHSTETEFLTVHFSWCYYANLVNAILCLAIGVATLIADLRCPDETADFFGNDVLQSYEDYFADPHLKNCPSNGNNGNGSQASATTKGDSSEVLLRKRPQPNQTFNTDDTEQGSSTTEVVAASGLKKRTTVLSNRFSRFQKSTIRKVVPSSQIELRNKTTAQPSQPNQPSADQQETPLYENYQFDTIGEETEL